jgi:endonuclease/exonuclease/phosphatase family metal-dependent hydrolase
VDGTGNANVRGRERRRLRLISYNIQAGVTTSKYSHYLTRSWQHLLPVPSRMVNLDGITEVIAGYDIVGLQEVDGGSLRSGFVNQVKYLSDRGGFPHVYDQTNRRIGVLSQHSNALLCRIAPTRVEDYRLPGYIPGRGVLRVCFGEGEHALNVFIIHMALGRRGRMRQIHFLASLIGSIPHVVVMGDLNCRSDSHEMRELLRLTGLCEPAPGLHTFPSWKPNRQLDHILVSPTIEVEEVMPLEHTFSDHLPISMRIIVPDQVRMVA